MNFTSNNDRSLSLVLRRSLKDALNELSNDSAPQSFNAQPMPVSTSTEPCSSSQMSSMMGLFPPTFSPSTSLASSQQQSLRPSALLGMRPEDLILAAEAEKRYVNQQNAATTAVLRQHAFRQSPRRSLMGLFQQGFVGSGVGALAQGNSLGIQSQALQQQETLQELGNALQDRSSPYIDVADAPDPDPSDSRVKKTRGGVTEPFPERLHRLLKEIEDDGNGDVISFLPHGRAFIIHNPEKFVSEIMPSYFKMSQLQSFQRQLNLYGFKRLNQGKDAGAYYHSLFLKNRPNMCILMRRVGLPKGHDRRKMRSKNVGVQVDPDFYSMKPV